MQTEKKDYKEMLMESEILLPNEEARQIKDNHGYFITDHARVISCLNRKVKALVQTPRSRTVPYDTVKLTKIINGDTNPHTIYVHRLVAEYFSDKILTFDTRTVDEKENPDCPYYVLIHHIKSYDPKDPKRNFPENLEIIISSKPWNDNHIRLHAIKPNDNILKVAKKLNSIPLNGSPRRFSPSKDGKGFEIENISVSNDEINDIRKELEKMVFMPITRNDD